MAELTHASFFTGVGGLDLGFERAGWRTVSHSEIEPYAVAHLAEHYPDTPNLGDITRVAPEDIPEATLWSGGFPCQDLSIAGKRRGLRVPGHGGPRHSDVPAGAAAPRREPDERPDPDAGEPDRYADLTRSGLAFAFLDLVERRRPEAILLENVPGLLSSHSGRDLGALIRRLEDLGYVGAYRVLDAQFFGVPQRRRRVFLLALDAQRGHQPDSAGEVLGVGGRCTGHPAEGGEEGQGAAGTATRSTDGASGPDIAGALSIGDHVGIQPNGQDAFSGQLVVAHALTAERGQRNNATEQNFVVAPTLTAPEPTHRTVGGRRQDGGRTDRIPLVTQEDRAAPDPGGVRAADGLAGRVDDSPRVAATLNSGSQDGGFRTEPGEHLVVAPTIRYGGEHTRDGGASVDNIPLVPAAYRKSRRAQSDQDDESWLPDDVTNTLNAFDVGDVRTTELLLEENDPEDDPLLPDGLDSHRYRAIGNGVVSPVAEWIAHRLAKVLETH